MTDNVAQLGDEMRRLGINESLVEQLRPRQQKLSVELQKAFRA